ncbi:MAG: hypothetical protein RL563_342 [Pseudomonadota bacterium]|jgi:hypothetical protein
MSDISSIASMATQMSMQKTSTQINVAVLKKAQDLQHQQAEQVMKLLASTAQINEHSLDVYV